MLENIRLQFETCADVINNQSLIQNCGLHERYLDAVVLPFALTLGGFLPALFWGVIVGAVYLKYQNGILAALIGVPVLAASSILLPSGANIAIPLMLASVIGIGLYYIVFRAKRTGQ